MGCTFILPGMEVIGKIMFHVHISSLIYKNKGQWERFTNDLNTPTLQEALQKHCQEVLSHWEKFLHSVDKKLDLGHFVIGVRFTPEARDDSFPLVDGPHVRRTPNTRRSRKKKPVRKCVRHS